MPIKTRRPTRLNIDDFISFVRLLLLWLAGQVADPDYRATLVDGLQAKFDALKAKFLEHKQLQIHVPEKNELYTNAANKLHKGLSMLKGLLPSFFDDPDILGFFGLADPIPDDLDELYSTGQICFDQWATVSAEPEYAPVAPDFDDVLVLFNDFVTKRDEYELKFQAMQAAQNDMEQLRAEIEEQERDLFNYYRSKHPKGDDPWWTDTPWGGTGGGEPEIPIPDWPGPATMTAEDLGGGLIEVKYGGIEDATHCDIEWKLKNAPDEDYVKLWGNLPMDPDEITALRERDVEKGKYNFRLVPYKDEEKGEVTVIELEVGE